MRSRAKSVAIAVLALGGIVACGAATEVSRTPVTEASAEVESAPEKPRSEDVGGETPVQFMLDAGPPFDPGGLRDAGPLPDPVAPDAGPPIMPPL